MKAIDCSEMAWIFVTCEIFVRPYFAIMCRLYQNNSNIKPKKQAYIILSTICITFRNQIRRRLTAGEHRDHSIVIQCDEDKSRLNTVHNKARRLCAVAGVTRTAGFPLFPTLFFYKWNPCHAITIHTVVGSTKTVDCNSHFLLAQARSGGHKARFRPV